MPGPEPFHVFTSKLDELGLPYMISGSVAAMYYGEPRMTNDVDIILVLGPEDASRLEAAFPPKEFYCPPHEVILIELGRSRRGHFNLIHHKTGFKADIYLHGNDPLHAWGLARAARVELEGGEVMLAPPEYVILRKLQYYREGGSGKHLRDIHRMLVALGDNWDRAGLQLKVSEENLGREWEAAQNPRQA
jgi:hypothetical protein